MEVLKKTGEIFLIIIKWLLIALLVIIFSALLIRFLWQRSILSKSKQSAISELAVVELNNKEQKILIEGKDTSKPILLIINDGLGSIVPFGISQRNTFEALINNYIVVSWDQYGFGKNQGEITSVNEYVTMIDDLINILKEKYNTKLYIFSYSYGTIISSLYATQYPNKVDGIISLGTYISNNTYIENVKNALSSKEVSEEDKDFINHCTNSYEDINKVDKLVNKYLDNNPIDIYKKYETNPFISPDYSLIDLYNIYVKDNSEKINTLKKEMEGLDMNSIYANISTPVLLIHGEQDYYLSESKVKSLSSNNSFIKHQMLKNCGHKISDGNWENVWTLISNFIYPTE